MTEGPLTSPVLAGHAALRHGFFTRRGGVSEGVYASLNCGAGSRDDPARVAENRDRAMTALGLPGDALATVYQVHSARVVAVDAPFPPAARPQADALVSARPGVALAVLTADCVPVLLADAEARVIGAVHAGWKGALAGVVEAAVAAMVGLGADRSRLEAALGPCIAQESYEVGADFPAPFLALNRADGRHFAPAERAGHYLFDLAGYVQARIEATGIGRVDRVAYDTRARDDLFFSYRRACLAGEVDYGRQLSAIALAPD